MRWRYFNTATLLAPLQFVLPEFDFNHERSTNDEPDKLPIYTKEQVAKHCTKYNKIFVYKGKTVYDITSFVDQHPGGEKMIMLAAGSSIEPFWKMYQQHYTPSVQRILESLPVVGILEDDDRHNYSDAEDDIYANDPARNKTLVVRKEKPFNAEVPLHILRSSYITPTELWYVRHHHPVPTIMQPNINIFTYNLSVTDLHGNERIFWMKDIYCLPKRTITCTLQCGGNRRSEYGKNVQGLPWNAGAISTAKFGGIWLSDLIDMDASGYNSAKHIQFQGADSPYDASVPIRKKDDVFLAYEMNGSPLPLDHGYPLRSIIPGALGARSVKWLTEITFAEEEAPSIWQRGIPYKALSPSQVDIDTIDPSKMFSILELPVQSVVCEAEVDEESKLIEVRGFAWSGGGRKIVRVDVSTDEGTSWQTATLEEGSEQEDGKAWAWTFWSLDIPYSDEPPKSVCCKATDSSMNTQPENTNAIWNIRGILNNSWHFLEIN